MFHVEHYQTLTNTNMYENQNLIVAKNDLKQGIISWQSPSNIAIVKYWGKHGVQLPNNPSISFTLSEAHTNTTIKYTPKTNTKDKSIDVELYFEGKHSPVFGAKTKKFFSKIIDIFPFISQFSFKIYSENTFPHSSGIASSASAMSAIALCLCSIEKELFGTLQDDASFYQKASYMSRLGSGSASRSVFSNMSIWGKSPEYANSSNQFAIGINQYDSVFNNFHDDILIVSSAEKSVSSTAGHQLMENNPFADIRYKQANNNIKELKKALESGDLEKFGNVAEVEALSLHALMMTSKPSYILMQANTLNVIHHLQAFRKASGSPIYFTLDAGPNPHILYPDSIKKEAQEFIKNELLPFSEQQLIINDHIGSGPKQLQNHLCD